ncbi:DNA-directed RNA polymerase [Purpureocillium lavendulum]|uniref:DNA-directed RNA polymerase n=1 Tax=Purpureocillium lavendulum TaxID=1247861 RepID=A0AB34G2R4_9HYPO|nr:DNA-directed RNA polymerase [Purpureocillium lavendulum]
MDPLSIAASVAGLIALVGKVAEVSRGIYTSVQKQPQLLARLTSELETFHAVLVELRCYLRDDEDGDQGALKGVSVGCKETMTSLDRHLTSLHEMFTMGRLDRLLSRSRFLELMSDIETATGSLHTYKQSLTIALQLRILKKQPRGIIEMNDACMFEDLAETYQQLKQQKLPRPVEQYIDINEELIELETSVHTPTEQPMMEDVDKIRSFGSFEDWLSSFGPESQALAANQAEDKTDTPHSMDMMPWSSKSTIRIRVRSPAREHVGDNGSIQMPDVDETMELKMTDFVHDAIDNLHQRG